MSHSETGCRKYVRGERCFPAPTESLLPGPPKSHKKKMNIHQCRFRETATTDEYSVSGEFACLLQSNVLCEPCDIRGHAAINKPVPRPAAPDSYAIIRPLFPEIPRRQVIR